MAFPFSDFLVSSTVFPVDVSQEAHSFGRNIHLWDPDTSNGIPLEVAVAIVGVPDDRGSETGGEALAVDQIRTELYRLAEPELRNRIIDMGNFRIGKSLQDTYFGLRELVEYLRGEQIIVLLIGGSSDLIFTAIPQLSKDFPKTNVVTVAPAPGMSNHPLTGMNTPLFQAISSGLIQYTNIGHQSCFTPVSVLEQLKKLKITSIRMGSVRTNILEAEPYLRDSQVTAITMDAVRSSDAPAASHPSPNGFYAEEICQLGFYSGNSTRCSVFGIFDCVKDSYPNTPTAQLAAQILWYFLEGLNLRTTEDPSMKPGQFVRYIIPLQGYDQTLTFYKSRKTDRYWIEAYCDDDALPDVVACTYADYQTACAGELPNRWMKTLDA